MPRARWQVLLYSLACSSDQKKTLLRQNALMMLLSLRVSTLTSGTKATGEHPFSFTRKLISLSISSSMGRPQWAHSVLTLIVSAVFLNRPCTKGAAKASTAQAA